MTTKASVPLEPVTDAQAEAIRVLAARVDELVERVRSLVRAGEIGPMAAVDRVAREAKPEAIVATAYLSLLATVLESKPQPPPRSH